LSVQAAIWGIFAVATGGVVLRPWRLPEAIWAVAGASALVLLSLVSWRGAFEAIAKGTDVYLFLTGMMLLAEVARSEGLFDWLAGHAASAAKGSAAKLFGLVYLAGIAVTAFLSNDATAVVLTPAVYAVAKAANAQPLPYLIACAFIANAASFLLPISNPANLVLYADHMPPLWPWLKQYTLPSLASIVITYAALRLIYRKALRGKIEASTELTPLTSGGWIAACGIGIAAAGLLLSSAYGVQLGVPTFAAGAGTALLVLAWKRRAPWPLLRDITWSVLPLVAALFVLVEGLQQTGAVAALTNLLRGSTEQSVTATAWIGGTGLAFVTNLMNNLPAGLIAQSALAPTRPPPEVTGAFLIGVDLGPNLSVTGSLATILWLAALKRDGVACSAATFLKVGALIMPPALIGALGALLLIS